MILSPCYKTRRYADAKKNVRYKEDDNEKCEIKRKGDRTFHF
jgi:hypothetical protein